MATLFALLETKTGYVIIVTEDETPSELEKIHHGRFQGWFATREEAVAERRKLEDWRRSILRDSHAD
jgi:hypothetical protein